GGAVYECSRADPLRIATFGPDPPPTSRSADRPAGRGLGSRRHPIGSHRRHPQPEVANRPSTVRWTSKCCSATPQHRGAPSDLFEDVSLSIEPGEFVAV